MKKQIFIALLSVFLLCGCAVKGDTISLEDVKVNDTSHLQNTKSVKFTEFLDSRREKPLIAVIKNSSNETVKSIFSSDDLGVWLSKALKKELSTASIGTKDSADITVGAKIMELYVEYTKNPLETKNLLLQAHIVMKLEHGGESLTKEYFVKEQKYISFLSGSSELTPHIQGMLSEIATSMATDISKWSATR